MRPGTQVRAVRVGPRSRLVRAASALLLLLTVSGCATVKGYQREFLADPIMAFDRDAREERRELHWREAREGSTGGIGVAGGGCACN
jgi:hypothetical protein